MSREHIWPMWFGRQFNSSFFNVKFNDRTWRAPSAAPLVVRRVCKACNEGWMGDIEQAASAILRPLVSASAGTTLSIPEQRALATFAVLKAMLLTLLQPDGTMIPESEYERFYRQRRPSGGITVVWMAASFGVKLTGQANVRPWRDDDDVINGYLITLAFHRVIFQVFDCFAAGLRLRISNERRGLGIIWPPQSEMFAWPPDDGAFHDDAFHEIDSPAMEIVQVEDN